MIEGQHSPSFGTLTVDMVSAEIQTSAGTTSAKSVYLSWNNRVTTNSSVTTFTYHSNIGNDNKRYGDTSKKVEKEMYFTMDGKHPHNWEEGLVPVEFTVNWIGSGKYFVKFADGTEKQLGDCNYTTSGKSKKVILSDVLTDAEISKITGFKAHLAGTYGSNSSVVIKDVKCLKPASGPKWESY